MLKFLIALRGENVKIYSIYDSEFKKYGTVLEGYDLTEILDEVRKIPSPSEGIEYLASCEALEDCSVKDEMLSRGFGSYPIQIGYVVGKNNILDCLEYHKTSEFNIAADDVILILGTVFEIENGKFDTSLAKAFLFPKGCGVELYATTLHYAPIAKDGGEYRIICVHPKATNAPKQQLPEKTDEDKMCYGVNKWLLCHPEAAHKNPGAYIGLTGENLTI